ncbi:NAD(P)H-dependent oxidoreductase [Pedobacter gandavensis]|uniref:NAD(P)H-dependent oxidoreductase n=1 Tax=Pedobacter gandavensis TaxID=2679963 RepID=UPI00292EB0CC|nr:NAD(P)H-dependent oxidoreductase [Pedobacter gandavensis]
MTRILIINGHPNRDSFNHALAEAYSSGAVERGALISQINISDLQFNPNLAYGYTQRIDLEPDLLKSLEKIKAADHLVWIHPVWWGGLPALMKGFIDRLFLPGIAFQYRENSIFWDRLLKGKTARIISTMDQPSWFYRLVYGNPSIRQLKKSTLEFCGVSPVKVSTIGIVKTSTAAQREKWLNKIYILGQQHK